MVNRSDIQLLVLLENGDRLAFNQMYDRYWKSLYTYTYNILKCPELTEDLLQDVFLKIWENRTALKIQCLKAYLFAACRNKAISVIRKAKFTDVEEHIISELSVTPKVDDIFQLNDTKRKIDSVTDFLPPRCQEIFRLSRFEQLTIAEISQHLGISQRTVENQLSLALKHIRKSLKSSAILSALIVILTFL